MNPGMMNRKDTSSIAENQVREKTAENEVGMDIGEQALSMTTIDIHQASLWCHGENKAILILADVIMTVTGLVLTFWKGMYP